jgi:hypothetical protein
MNTCNDTGLLTTLEEWKDILRQEELKKSPKTHGPEYDLVQKTSTYSVLSSDLNLSEKRYEAYLFGTDADYLDNSKTRSFFKDNAINPEDCKLFEMPEVTKESREDEDEVSSTMSHIPGLCCQYSDRLPARSSRRVVYILMLLTLVFVITSITAIYFRRGR